MNAMYGIDLPTPRCGLEFVVHIPAAMPQAKLPRTFGAKPTSNGIDNKLKMSSNGRTYHFLQDHLGSTVGITDSGGGLTDTNTYDSFGNPSNSSFSTRYQFTGREFDSFSGLQYSRARWYHPLIGRFISEDPIGFRGGDVNLYGYVNNNPSNNKDPFGKCGTHASCERDFTLMEKTYRESLDFMNNNSNRSWGPLNGIKGTIFGSSPTDRPSCADQAAYVRDRLRGNLYENNDWNFDLDYLGFDLSEETFGSWRTWHFHTWVKASSPTCGSRRFDPWLG